MAIWMYLEHHQLRVLERGHAPEAHRAPVGAERVVQEGEREVVLVRVVRELLVGGWRGEGLGWRV